MFYVDDHLNSKATVEEALSAFVATRNMCAEGNFNLNKFVSNSKELMELVPADCVSPSVIDLNMSKQHVDWVERALGTYWCLENDTIGFSIVLQDKPLSRRGVLSTIGSIHDPIGIAGPFVLPGRKTLQQITVETKDWDDDLSPEQRSAWEKWRNTELPELEKIKVDRCYKPKGFKPVSKSLHSYSDASDYGYGEVTYLRQVSEENEVCVALVMAKSRVVPRKQTTIPRMELTAAVLSAKITALVKEELDMTFDTETYWVDSMIVLGYIQNLSRRYRTYVANRQKKIHNLSDVESWNHCDTDENPADFASRGLSMSDKEKVSMWLYGPPQLWEKDNPAEKPIVTATVLEDDPELQVSISSNSVMKEDCHSILHILETWISEWMRMKHVMSRVMIFIDILRKQRTSRQVTTGDLVAAESAIVKMLQEKHFPKERALLKAENKILASSKIKRLDPFLDEHDILRVGGRLRKAPLLHHEKHPIILPKKEVIVTRLLEFYHKEVAHLGRTSTLNEVRSNGYWVIAGNSQVNKIISKCVDCRGLRGQAATQKMSDLPEERVSPEEAPFTYCGLDMFGPFTIKEGRKELKRYGQIFTCFSCRAVHIETTTTMDTDSFILALRRFICRRGPVRSIKSDNGGNFVGVEGEMKRALQEMDQKKISAFLLKHDCDWIEWNKNPPKASHMGGIWERQIRTVRSVLSGLLKAHAARLDDETLRTLFVEVEAIVNSRPLAVDTLTDVSIDPLTPNHLLTMKSKVVLPPPGVFQPADVYCRKRWRTVQFMTNEFWRRFSKEYLQASQERQKWNDARRNLAVDDVVLIMEEDVGRNRWPMGVVIEVFPSDDGLVRTVNLRIAGSQVPLKRPVTKLVVLVEASK